MLTIQYTNKMKRDAKRVSKRGRDISKLTAALNLLASGEQMPENYKDHPLKGEMRGYRECHIEPDWLLIYKIYGQYITFIRTGTHSDLF